MVDGGGSGGFAAAAAVVVEEERTADGEKIVAMVSWIIWGSGGLVWWWMRLSCKHYFNYFPILYPPIMLRHVFVMNIIRLHFATTSSFMYHIFFLNNV